MEILNKNFYRLTAPYLFILGVVQVCMKWHNYNSVFEPPTMDHINCPEYWWRNVLYINTLYPVEEMVRKNVTKINSLSSIRHFLFGLSKRVSNYTIFLVQTVMI